jgi:Protein of unknown function (DUF3000)
MRPRPVAGLGSRDDISAAAFRTAVAELEAGLSRQRDDRPEVCFDTEPPPRRLAPYAAAIAATVTRPGPEPGPGAGADVGWGRFVLLYDPAGQPGWAGPFRIIGYLRAELEPEIAADPLIGQVGWTWLTEALDARAAGYRLLSGTVTRVVTEGFGTKQGDPVTTGFELRASWSPAAADGTVPPGPGRDGPGASGLEIDGHAAAWCDALCTAAGLPPLAPGVSALAPPRRRRPR